MLSDSRIPKSVRRGKPMARRTAISVTRSRADIAIVFAAIRSTTVAMTAVRVRKKSFTLPRSAT